MIVMTMKKQKYKKVRYERKLKFEKYKIFLEATKLENKIKYFKKIKINIDSLKKIIKNS